MGGIFSPICSQEVPESDINLHIDNNCRADGASNPKRSLRPPTSSKSTPTKSSATPKTLAPIFSKPQIDEKSSQDPFAEPNQSFDNTGGTSPHTERPPKRVSFISAAEPSAKRVKTDVDSADGAKQSKRIPSNFRAAAPLAERLRPRSLADFVGQTHLVGPNSLLMHLVRSGGGGGSMILWGPPG
jgi:putative ATPase